MDCSSFNITSFLAYPSLGHILTEGLIFDSMVIWYVDEVIVNLRSHKMLPYENDNSSSSAIILGSWYKVFAHTLCVVFSKFGSVTQVL